MQREDKVLLNFTYVFAIPSLNKNVVRMALDFHLMATTGAIKIKKKEKTNADEQ